MSVRFHIASLATILGLAGLSACPGKIKLVRVAAAPATSGPPSVDRVVDLGAQPVPTSGAFVAKDSDGYLSPGEWVAVLGKGLGAGARVSLGGTAVQTAGYLSKGLLFQVPRGLDPRSAGTLVVRTPAGMAQRSVKLRSWVATADRRARKLRLMELGSKGLSDKVRSISLGALGPQAFSPDGSLLYVLIGRGGGGRKEVRWARAALKLLVKPTRVSLSVAVVAMGAGGGPNKTGEVTVGLDSKPTRMLSPAAGQLLVLSEGHLLWLDRVGAGGAPTERGRLDLREEKRRTCYSGLRLLAPGRVALLDPCTNTLLQVDLGAAGLQRRGTPLDLAPGTNLPLSVDLAGEPGQPDVVWVLQGPNFLVPREVLKRGLGKLKTGARNLLAPLLGKRRKAPEAPKPPPGAAPAPPPPPPPPAAKVVSRLVKLRLGDGAPEVLAELPLPPKFFPTSLAPLGAQRVAVTGLNGNVFDFAGVKASFRGLKKILKILVGAVMLGRVVVVSEGGQPEEKMRGVALYFQAGRLSGDIPVGVLRPTARVFPPGVRAQWGLELGRQFVALSTLDYKSLLPPYVFAPIVMQ